MLQALGDIKRLSMSVRQLQLENCEAIGQMGYDLSELIQMPKGLGSCYPLCSLRSVRDKFIVCIYQFSKTQFYISTTIILKLLIYIFFAA